MLNSSQAGAENQVLSQTGMSTPAHEPVTQERNAIEVVVADEGEESAILPIREALGNRFMFFANMGEKPSRLEVLPKFGTSVVVENPRTGNGKSQGLVPNREHIIAGFGSEVYTYPHRTQVIFELSDGTRWYGYVRQSQKSRIKAIYIPARYVTEGIELPRAGEVLPVRVAKLIIG